MSQAIQIIVEKVKKRAPLHSCALEYSAASATHPAQCIILEITSECGHWALPPQGFPVIAERSGRSHWVLALSGLFVSSAE